MAGDSRKTTHHNISTLIECGFVKQKNTSVFCKDGKLVLSPAVSRGKDGKYWFDIRKINFDKLNTSSHSSIMLRIIPDIFVWINTVNFLFLLSEDSKRERKNSGEVWGFYTFVDDIAKRAKIVSITNSSLSYTTSTVEKDEIKLLINNPENLAGDI